MEAGYRPNAAFAAAPGAGAPPLGVVAPGATAVWGQPGGNRTAAAVGNPGGAYGNAQRYAALTFIAQPDAGDLTGASALKQVQLGPNAANKIVALEAVGKARFDTRIVRNLFFITNIQRLMRLKLNQELTQYRNVLVSNHSVVNPGVTEYGYLPPSSTSDSRLRQYGPGNETTGDRRYDNETRLVE
jgi:hypothetical protein